MKNQANIAAAHSTPTTLAVATLRSRNRPSGISGARTRASMREEDRQQHRRGGEQAERLQPTSSRPRCRSTIA